MSVLSPIWAKLPPLVRAGKVEVVLALNLNELGHSVALSASAACHARRHPDRSEPGH